MGTLLQMLGVGLAYDRPLELIEDGEIDLLPAGKAALGLHFLQLGPWPHVAVNILRPIANAAGFGNYARWDLSRSSSGMGRVRRSEHVFRLEPDGLLKLVADHSEGEDVWFVWLIDRETADEVERASERKRLAPPARFFIRGFCATFVNEALRSTGIEQLPMPWPSSVPESFDYAVKFDGKGNAIVLKRPSGKACQVAAPGARDRPLGSV